MSNLTHHALASLSDAAHNQADGAPQRGTFRAVLADPPWCSQQTGRHGAAQHYRLMPLPRLRAMGEAVREITAPRSFCFVWVTTATVPQGIELLEAWGFRYTSFYFWAKPRFSMGHTFRNAGELLLLGVRGQGIRVAFWAQPNWGFHPLQEHSHKPEEIHQIVERLVGNGPFVELFARRAAPSRQHPPVAAEQLDRPDQQHHAAKDVHAAAEEARRQRPGADSISHQSVLSSLS